MSSSTVSMEITAMAKGKANKKKNKKKTKPPHSSMTMTNVSAPYLLQLTVQRLRVTSCQDYTDVFRSFFIFHFFASF